MNKKCLICEKELIDVHHSVKYCEICRIIANNKNSKKYNNSEKFKQYIKEYHKRPDVIERLKIYRKEYHKRPDVIERLKIYIKEYRQRPEVIEKLKIYNQLPHIRIIRSKAAARCYKKIEDIWKALPQDKKLELMNKRAKELIKDNSLKPRNERHD